ncbi:MAG TPA: hydantoinase B/oxoprolinase family protein, partial [Acidimicrobiales bacterium]|nr:hydantoinase B/oxoprolinase family protein [Acidimicrobiales bacterium]
DRTICFLGDGDFLNVVQKTISPPWPIAGGKASEPTRIVAYAGSERERAISIERIAVVAGDRVVLHTAGGAGFGDPLERDRDAVRADVAEGYVSPERARIDYGLE